MLPDQPPGEVRLMDDLGRTCDAILLSIGVEPGPSPWARPSAAEVANARMEQGIFEPRPRERPEPSPVLLRLSVR